MKQEEALDSQNHDDQLIKYLAMITAFSQQMASRNNREQKKWWNSFLEPAVLTALITVIFGSLAGGLITHFYQEGAKNRELQQVAYKDYLSQQQEVLKRTYSLLGICFSSTKRLIDQSNPIYYDENYLDNLSDEDFEKLRQQDETSRRNFNEAYFKWVLEQTEVGLLIDYYHPNQPEVVSSWEKIQESTTAYMHCARDWTIKHGEDNPVRDNEEFKAACKQEFDAVKNHLTEMNVILKNVRRYPWLEMETRQLHVEQKLDN